MAGRVFRTNIVVTAIIILCCSLTSVVCDAQPPIPIPKQGTVQTTDSGDMQINVKNLNVADILQMIADAGGFDIAISNDVKGTITVFADETSPRELLDTVVGLVGAAYVEENGVIQVMKAEVYATKYGESFANRVRTEIIPLKFAHATEISATISGGLDKAAVVTPIGGQNLLRIKASPAQITEAKRMIAALDLPVESRSYDILKTPISVIAPQIKELLPSNTRMIEDAINGRLVVTAPAHTLEYIGHLITVLDVGQELESAAFTARFTTADSLAAKLEPHLTPDIGQIFSDNASRQIYVSDFPSSISTVYQLVEMYDVPVRQVLIEARIVQISVNNTIKSGIDWAVVQDQINITGTFPALVDGTPGFRGDFGDLTSKNYEVLIQALNEYGETNLLSSPRLTVADHGTSAIHVGSQVPYKTIDTRETSGGIINQFEKVTIVDVGVKLTVTAHILGDDMIRMSVKPEVSSVTSFIEKVPVVEASMIESDITIQNGNTAILGGLIKEEIRSTTSGVPILSSIPVVKYLFSSTSDEKVRSEMVILLTPKITSGKELYTDVPTVEELR